MKVAVVGATGLVGRKMLQVLRERNFPCSEILAVASERSVGKTINVAGEDFKIISVEEALKEKPSLALFSAGAAASRELAPNFAAIKCRVVDNSSCFRMDKDKKLIVPEINGDILTEEDYIIANPNCSTIQMLIPLYKLHKEFIIKRIVVSTYQSVTGSGNKAVQQLEAERAGEKDYTAYYPYEIDKNIIPHIDVFLDTAYTKEEQKMVDETHKILNDYNIGVSPTAARVPVLGGHSESINVEFEKDFTLERIREIWEADPAISVRDKVEENIYPMPLFALDTNEVYVGRLRRDTTAKYAINFWCVADNIRKGAATNAVQIAEILLKKHLI